MPESGEIRKAFEIGYQRAKWWQKYIFHACVDCGKERWVQLNDSKPRNLRCNSCAKRGERHPLYGVKRELHPRWKGGEWLSGDGYMMVLMPEHPRANYGYIKRAVLVLEEKLGRPIKIGYDCHHKNSIRTDDRPENLEEHSHSTHTSLHLRKRCFNRAYEEPIITVTTR